MLALLRFVENPRDRVAGFRVLQLLPGVGPASAQRVLDAMADARRSARGALPSMPAPPRAGDDWTGLRRRCCSNLRDGRPAGRPSSSARASGTSRISSASTRMPRSRQADLLQLEQIAARLSVARALPDRADARSARRHQRPGRRAAARRGLPDPLDHPFGQGPGVEDRSSCSTSSTAASRPISAPARRDEIEEERRLLYVAMTRAKDDLHLVVPQRFFIHGQHAKGDRHVYASRTRFIPATLLGLFERTAWPHGAAGTAARAGAQGRSRCRRPHARNVAIDRPPQATLPSAFAM